MLVLNGVSVQILIATDVAARGLDIKGLNTVGDILSLTHNYTIAIEQNQRNRACHLYNVVVASISSALLYADFVWTQVVNYDLARTLDQHIHRIGNFVNPLFPALFFLLVCECVLVE